MNLTRYVFVPLVFILFLFGCSFGEISKEESHTYALEFAMDYAEEEGLEIPKKDIYLINSEKVKDGRVVFLNYKGNNTDPLETFPMVWVSVTNSKSIKGYNFIAWGGGDKSY
ncbi:hypothetical protein [Ornithinibacillus californiensis]|uniref:hypothetical protein n=1 Tax=Ornithinibacillus californiensis TaxID=161536 RepID=UPI00064D747E|nr:hypothetical protein [Ornithinibacillus californiensis]